MKQTFKKGDKVKVVDGIAGLPAGAKYVVARVEGGFVHVAGNIHGASGGWYVKRFVLDTAPVKVAAPNKVKRLPNGRFASASPIVEKPIILRKSAIYKVKRKRGFSLAKFVASVSTKGTEFVVLAAHGKPFVVKKSNVFFANKEDVKTYLQPVK